MITLTLEGISDQNVRQNFQKLAELINTNPLLAGEFKHFQITVSKPSSNYRIRHGLKFKPKDILVTWVSNPSATVTVLYSSTTTEHVVLDISAACEIRLLIGSAPD